MIKPGTNLLKLTDSYKFCHWRCYPPGTQRVFSYFESRGGWFDKVTFFGLQMLLERLEGEVVTTEKINDAENLVNAHMGPGVFNRAGWEYIRDVHNGKLPVIIKAVPEGAIVPNHNALMTIENTDDECFWLTNFLETYLVQVWYPSTVATFSREIKKVILDYLNLTGDPSLINFKLHDFGFRGVSSYESAGIGGCAHLVNFMGTDTIAAIEFAQYHYGADMPAFSIPAAEHSTITSWGREHEVEAFTNMLRQYPTGLVAVVSDSYNIYEACKHLWGNILKDMVLERDGTLIIRPDSGEPVKVILEVLNILGDSFGYEINSKGYKVLNPKVRIIQGDGVDYDAIELILREMVSNGWSTDNLAFGMGGGLLQKLNRDTQKFAFKCSSVTINGEEQDVFKQPVDCAWKKSKAGRLKTIKMKTSKGENWLTVNEQVTGDNITDMLETVFLNGEIVKRYTFDEVRENAKI